MDVANLDVEYQNKLEVKQRRSSKKKSQRKSDKKKKTSKFRYSNLPKMSL